MLAAIYQNKTKVPGDSSKFRVQLLGELSFTNYTQAI